MNTLSILDANTANLPEGLYLKLVNALKKDFNKNKTNENSFTITSFRSFIGETSYVGLDPEVQAECSCRFLNNITDKQNLIEYLFNNEFKNEFYYIQETKDCKRIYSCDCCDNYVKECDCFTCEICDYNYCLKCADGNGVLCADCRPYLSMEHKNYQMIFN